MGNRKRPKKRTSGERKRGGIPHGFAGIDRSVADQTVVGQALARGRGGDITFTCNVIEPDAPDVYFTLSSPRTMLDELIDGIGRPPMPRPLVVNPTLHAQMLLRLSAAME